MKFNKIATIAALALSTQAFAQGDAVESIEAKVEFVSPLTASDTAPLNFGVLTTDWKTVGGDIVVTADGARDADASIEVFSDDRLVTTGKVTFSGWSTGTIGNSQVAGIVITADADVLLDNANGDNAANNYFNTSLQCLQGCGSHDKSYLASNAEIDVVIGGTLTHGTGIAGLTADVFQGSFDVTAAYE